MVYSLKGGYLAWLMGTMEEENEKDEKEETPFYLEVEQSIRKRFKKKIWCRFTKAINDYELVKEGDKIAVCISGGKDSMLMAKLFQELKRHHKFPFEVVFLVMDPGYSPENRKVIENNARRLNIPVTIFESNIFEAVFHVEKSPCYLCARMRRGYLYSKAKELGCNKIALGHHYDDVIETILMGMLYGAQMQTMMPKLHSSNFEGMELIRPLYFTREANVVEWAEFCGLTFLPCDCPAKKLENDTKRAEIKQMIASLASRNPQIEANIFNAVKNVDTGKLLGWRDENGRHSFLDRL